MVVAFRLFGIVLAGFASGAMASAYAQTSAAVICPGPSPSGNPGSDSCATIATGTITRSTGAKASSTRRGRRREPT